jgi:iron complex transport system permease protein
LAISRRAACGHAGVSLGSLALALVALPFVARELDLLAFGEEDARSLGVSTRRVQLVVVLLSSLLVASSVAVAGQIAFLGLVAPNLVRLVVGPRHRQLLPAAALCGASLLLMADMGDRLSPFDLRPGVLLSLLGAPVFLVLVARGRRELSTW